jgi:MOSC domain-containing protein YiiM/ferredoxin-NADP reductase
VAPNRSITNGKSLEDMAPMAQLISVNVGMPRDIGWRGRTVFTGIWKTPVRGPRHISKLNVDGDGQGDLAGHGGEQRAVFVYQMDSYRYWETLLGRRDLTHGQFGENFTIEGLPDNEVCIGDRYRIGNALFEVTQPRTTCYRVGIRMDKPDMGRLLTSSGRPGFYFRVLEEGQVSAGDALILVHRETQRMTVAVINALLYSDCHPRALLERALKIPALSPGWQHSFEALLLSRSHQLDAIGSGGLVAGAPDVAAASGFRRLRVVHKTLECADVVSLILQPTDQKPLTLSLAGQFVVLRVCPLPLVAHEGLFEPTAARFRSYSLSGGPSDQRYRISVKAVPGGEVGGYLMDVTVEGDLLDVSAPRGGFALQPGIGAIVLLSAGIGATPMIAMLHALAATSSTRPIWWVHGAKNGAYQSFSNEVRKLLSGLPDHRSFVWYSRPGAEDRSGVDYDAVGHVTLDALIQAGMPRTGDFYICGPGPFLVNLRAALIAWGVAEERIHSEVFGSGTSLNPGVVHSTPRPPHQPIGEDSTGPQVSFSRSGITAHWRVGDQSVLELAEACDIPVRWSCRNGVCHNCESGLVSGLVSYAPQPLAPPADGNVLICCARPLGDVVLDL